MFIRNSKRSSSTSNDSLYERDRFRARLHNFNVTVEEPDQCEVCDTIGSKTARLNVRKHDQEEEEFTTSLLSPLDMNSAFYKTLDSVCYEKFPENMKIMSLKIGSVEPVFNWYFNKPLPNTRQMFPWLHGLHPKNFSQRRYFIKQEKKYSEESVDEELLCSKPYSRFLMTVNASIRDHEGPILKNNTLVNEVLCPIDISRDEVCELVKIMVLKVFPNEESIDTILEVFLRDIFELNYLPMFLDLDPLERGVSLRNYHIQVAKSAICSDFIIYCFDEKNLQTCHSLARLFWLAQRFEEANNSDIDGESRPVYNTFVLTDFDDIGLATKIQSVTLKNKFPSKNFDLNEMVKLSLKFLQNWDTEYIIKEKIETIKMSSASRLNGCLYSGNSWDYQNFLNFIYSGKKEYLANKKLVDIKNLYCNPLNSITTSNINSENLIETILPLPNLNYKMFINCFNEANFPDKPNLESLLSLFSKSEDSSCNDVGDYFCLTFPSSGSIGLGDITQDNIISILNTCKLLYLISCVKNLDSLIYCSDGYTESSLLILIYTIYSTNTSLNRAIITLHLKYGRPFYIFNTDVQILSKLEPILRKYSPVANDDVDWEDFEEIPSKEVNQLLLSPRTLMEDFRKGIIESSDLINDDEFSSSSSSSSSGDESFIPYETDWCKEVEGSLPSRILPYLYLGSLKHASCLPLLKELGIKKVISVGEPLSWLNGSKFQRDNDIIIDELNNGDIELYNIVPNDKTKAHSPVDQVMKVNNLQDDGIAQLESSLPVILDYIEEQYQISHGQTKILVHCRVGVSRSATVVIAEVMRRLKINLPKAYLYVRVRRLNIIIQPNLKFMYELFKWEELHKQEHDDCLREIDWFAMCREITSLNTPYLTN
ncbi:hypothetical protein CANTEDRAFT_124350 [Yamadazyma tenuis ATCC 10573]|uniref:Uncharacterized protein n=2 Tax=Candida tenuis TaxID=2315449 RepID=G3BBI0_CANTC|nr:uncharacterized protein CANTEDRAFT_124350 [Yamadazyma tenuis ATCC 10573]EGV61543.1 hypothetical protein CANTEDRAFT_124350 [Yamadazyma tenuis ATCC 10573]